MSREVLPRGLIEVSNICAKDCLYCGIRRSQPGLRRYHLTLDEVKGCCDEAVRRGFKAVAFQAGEIESEENTRFYESACHYAKGELNLEITLSLGEQTEEIYRRWKEAGAIKYLLRIETSNRELYAKIHPSTCSFDRRLECLRTLKRLGYITGSGVMIGLPGQTKEDLARDLDFFEAEHLDMIGMGPYIPTPGTPLATTSTLQLQLETTTNPLDLSLWMIREVRRRMPHVNIVAATALDALDPEHGRERALVAGANVIMPNLTPAPYISDYALYPGKPLAKQVVETTHISSDAW